MPVRVDIEMCFELHSGMHTTGDRAELWTDKAITRDWHEGGKPVVPATSIKGWLRESAERVLRGFGQAACDASQPSTICGRCLVCQVFGSPYAKSPLRFEDAVLDEAITDTRIGVSLSRYRRTAYEEQLFTMEVAWSKTLTTKVSGLFTSRDKSIQAVALLWVAAKAGWALGAARSRGMGWVKLEAFMASCDGVLIPEGELQAIVQRWQGELYE